MRQSTLFPMDDDDVVETPAAAVVDSGDFARASRLLIRASAGTGKTFQLSNRYLSLLRRAPADRILAVTFTRKAAGEILERILTRLAAAVLDDKKRRDLSKFLGGKALTAEECRALLATTVRQLHRVKVATLDSFFSRLATSMPLELGLSPNWSIADDHVARGLVQQAIDLVLQEGTEVTTKRIVHLLAKGVVPRSIARLMTDTVQTHFEVFRLTQAAAWNRIEPGYPLSGEEVDVLLVELEQLDLPQHKSFRQAHENDVRACRAGDWDVFLEGGIAEKVRTGGATYYSQELPSRLVSVYSRLIHHGKAIVLKTWAGQIAAVHELLTEVDHSRQKLLAESHVLRFDDIAFALANRMQAVDSRAIVHRLDGDIDHLLLDEFQDTSLLQWDVLRPFVTALDSRRDTSFFCVGDVKQAIYGWRGGVAALFDKVQSEVRDVQTGMLNVSRRSAPAIMTAVNQVFQNLTRHPSLGDAEEPVKEWQASFPEHSTALDLPGYVRLETGIVITDQQRPADARSESCVGRAVDIVAELHGKRPDLTIGVLTRRNEVVGRVIHQLAARGIQASEEGGVRLTTSAAAQLVQSLLRFAEHPGHSIARFHVAHSPLGALFGIRPLMTAAEAHSAALAVRSQLAADGYESAIERWSLALSPLCSSRDRSRLRRLSILGASCDAIGGVRPSDLADRIDDERVEEPTASAVRVMTIHKSKGLEFDIVVLPDVDEALYDDPKVCVGSPGPAERPETVLIKPDKLRRDLLPADLARAFDQQRRLDVHESLCCLYVAMTRAVHGLYMVIAPQAKTKKGETTCHKTASGLLRATLGSQHPHLPPAHVLYEYGHANWYDEMPAPAEPSPVGAATKSSTDPIVLKPHAGGRVRGRQAASPSQSKASRGVKATHVLSLDAGVGMERGTLWHLWCQKLRWHNDASLDPAHLTAIGQPHCREASRLQEEVDAFRSAIGKAAIRKLFEQESVAKSRPDLGADLSIDCLTESRFSMFLDGRWLTGAVDRLVLYRRAGQVVGADVIDFKTDLAGEASPLRAAYREQIRQYAVAVARVYGVDASSIRSMLVWLTTGAVEVVS